MISLALAATLFAQYPVAPSPRSSYADSCVAAMNAERSRCGTTNRLTSDARLNAIAKARLDYVKIHGIGHFLADGSDPRPALCDRFGFPRTSDGISEGNTMGSYEPAGLTYHLGQPFRRGVLDHHNDLIDPHWNSVGFAYGSADGVAYSVTIFGHDPVAPQR